MVQYFYKFVNTGFKSLESPTGNKEKESYTSYYDSGGNANSYSWNNGKYMSKGNYKNIVLSYSHSSMLIMKRILTSV